MEINKFFLGLTLFIFPSCNEGIKSHDRHTKETKIEHTKWLYMNKDSSDVFELNINVNTKTGRIYGNHCFVVNNGDKVDCAKHQSQITFIGKLSHNTAAIKFKSFFKEDSLDVILQFKGDSTLQLSTKDIGGALIREEMLLKKQ